MIVWDFNFCIILLCGGSNLDFWVKKLNRLWILSHFISFITRKSYFLSRNRLFRNLRKVYFVKIEKTWLGNKIWLNSIARNIKNWDFRRFIAVCLYFKSWEKQKTENTVFRDNHGHKLWEFCRSKLEFRKPQVKRTTKNRLGNL